MQADHLGKRNESLRRRDRRRRKSYGCRWARSLFVVGRIAAAVSGSRKSWVWGDSYLDARSLEGTTSQLQKPPKKAPGIFRGLLIDSSRYGRFRLTPAQVALFAGLSHHTIVPKLSVPPWSSTAASRLVPLTATSVCE